MGTSNELATQIGLRARRLRLAQGRRLAEVATAARLSIGALSEIENGKREARLAGYERLAKTLGVSLAQLLGLLALGPHARKVRRPAA